MRGLLAALALLAAIAAPARAEERILDFDSRLEVRKDGALDVTETIRVNAENVDINRGIFRDFPTRYQGRRGERIKVGFELIETLRDGRAEQSAVERVKQRRSNPHRRAGCHYSGRRTRLHHPLSDDPPARFFRRL